MLRFDVGIAFLGEQSDGEAPIGVHVSDLSAWCNTGGGELIPSSG
jgi:hypothetical protein